MVTRIKKVKGHQTLKMKPFYLKSDFCIASFFYRIPLKNPVCRNIREYKGTDRNVLHVFFLSKNMSRISIKIYRVTPLSTIFQLYCGS